MTLPIDNSLSMIGTFESFQHGDSDTVSKFCKPFGWACLGKPQIGTKVEPYHPAEGLPSEMYDANRTLTGPETYTLQQYSPGKNYNDPFIRLNIHEIIGLEPATRLLVDIIGKPRMTPEHYGPHGQCQTQRMACIYGPVGSGKCTLIQAIAQRYNMNLLIVDGRYNDDGMMGILLQYAILNTPCIIYFDGCDHFFNERAVNSNRGLEFVYNWEQEFQKASPDIWAVFGTPSLPNQLLGGIQNKLGPNHRYAQPPNELQRKLLFYRFLQSKYDQVNFNVLNASEFSQLLQYLSECSQFCTPQMISNYCDAVFQAKRANCSLEEMRTHNTRSKLFLPDMDCFNQVLVISDTGARITQLHPRSVQMPYIDYQHQVTQSAAVKFREEDVIKRALNRSTGHPPVRSGNQLQNSSNSVPQFKLLSIEPEPKPEPKPELEQKLDIRAEPKSLPGPVPAPQKISSSSPASLPNGNARKVPSTIPKKTTVTTTTSEPSVLTKRDALDKSETVMPRRMPMPKRRKTKLTGDIEIPQ